MLSGHQNFETVSAKCSSTCEDITNQTEVSFEAQHLSEGSSITWSVIDAIDLDFLILKLTDDEFGPGWSEDQSRSAINRFKKFFYLVGTSRGGLVPTKEIDWVWHSLILHTKRYNEICLLCFGRFIHHNPGGNEEGSDEYFSRKFSETSMIFSSYFGETYLSHDMSHCTPDSEGGCSHCDGTDSG